MVYQEVKEANQYANIILNGQEKEKAIYEMLLTHERERERLNNLWSYPKNAFLFLKIK